MSNILARSYSGGKAVTKSDTTPDPQGPFAGLFVTVTGNLSFVTVEGDSISLTSVPAFTELRFAVSRVNSTGTSATVLGLRAAPYKPSVSS